ncbi:MAG TPA: tRNA (guanosine(46)-N7)-methyltransferase TrmB [Chitinophagales bacterium]|nr:tRNA (guanosine(46)-N7)-methyltransferase TrmB [Chitinophagales bacterium]
MGKAKMFKINSINSFPNVYQNTHYTNPNMINHEGVELDMKGKWKSEVFKNDNPIVLELACGKGDYALALARRYPNKNFVGVDSKGARIFTGSKTALDEGLTNVAFARFKIENILNYFAAGEVDEIWITFPDPFPKLRDAKRRLSAPKFLERYRQIAKPGAVLHFKTDDLPLHLFTKEMAQEFSPEILYCKEDIYSTPLQYDELSIQTYYEKKHLAEGRTINYIRFLLSKAE